MSRQRNRRQLSIQSLETRKLMAADGIGSGVYTENGFYLDTDGSFSFSSFHGSEPAPIAGSLIGQAIDSLAADGNEDDAAYATDAVMARWSGEMSPNRFYEFTFVDM